LHRGEEDLSHGLFESPLVASQEVVVIAVLVGSGIYLFHYLFIAQVTDAAAPVDKHFFQLL